MEKIEMQGKIDALEEIVDEQRSLIKKLIIEKEKREYSRREIRSMLEMVLRSEYSDMGRIRISIQRHLNVFGE